MADTQTKLPSEIANTISGFEAAPEIKKEQAYLSSQEDVEWKRAHIKALNQNTDERKKYARWIFIFTCSWAAIIMSMVMCAGSNGMKFSDTIIITLITSTMVNFFGFFLLVVKYLFNPQKSM
ncbi:MAG: hypothetical protein ABI763_00390 [Bacteroidota bacterium]